MIDLSVYVKSLNNRKIAVFGLGVSGVSVVRALIKAGAKVIAWDDGEESREAAEKIGAEINDLTLCLDNSFDFLVLAPGVPLTHPKPHDVVLKARENGVEIIGDLELLNRGLKDLGSNIKTIGITGTNGKSTTTALMEHVLNECGVNALAAGNIGVPVLELDLSETKVLVLEISSYQMDLCPDFRPDIALILNITPDHLDRHGDIAGYTKAKARILDSDGVKIIGVDTSSTAELAKITEGVIKISVEGNDADIFVKDGILYDGNERVADISNFKVLKSEHNYQNIACVYATAKKLNLQGKYIFSAIESFKGLAHRQYSCGHIGKVEYINDSKATNAEATAKALGSYDNIYWILGGLPKDGGLNGLEKYMPKIKKAYLIGKAAKDFKLWLDIQGVESYMCSTIDIATQKAHEDAQNSDEKGTVLLAPACASWDQFKSFEKRGDAFMDIVKALKSQCNYKEECK